VKKKQHLAILKAHDIDVCYIHAHSEISSNELWVQGISGDKLIEELSKSIEDCSTIHVPIMVMHITAGNVYPKPNYKSNTMLPFEKPEEFLKRAYNSLIKYFDT